jgi:hypothetical protein
MRCFLDYESNRKTILFLRGGKKNVLPPWFRQTRRNVQRGYCCWDLNMRQEEVNIYEGEIT